ncbi:MAG: hypothetical protein IE909_00155 [Campylobacterales bacterium]|nr:hypothetical protein [Campylobacterales bacterium]
MNIGIIDAIRDNDLEEFINLTQNDHMSKQLCLNLALSFESYDIIDYLEDELHHTQETFQSQTIVHNGLEYKTVLSKTTGKIWLDRNLGALNCPSTLDDPSSFGDYYQWGRSDDGHEKYDSQTTNIIAQDPLHASDKFITVNATTSYNWLDHDDNKLWNNLNSICPKGFRIPTIKEIHSELITTQCQNNYDAFGTILKLPSGGYKEYIDGVIKDIGTGGSLWSTSFKGTNTPQAVYFYKSGVGTFPSYKGNGHNIRCIAN